MYTLIMHNVQNKALQRITKWRHDKVLRDDMLPLRTVAIPSLSLPRLSRLPSRKDRRSEALVTSYIRVSPLIRSSAHENSAIFKTNF